MNARWIRALSRLYPWSAAVDDELRRSLRYLGSAESPATVVRAAYGAGLLATSIAPLLVAFGTPPQVAIALGIAASAGIAYCGRRLPIVLAAGKRTAALGAAPDLVVRAVLRMRIEPTAERAADFAAETGESRLAASLGDHARRAVGTPRTGLGEFGDEWADWLPALRRATALIEAAADAPAGERDRTLDRATGAVFDGTRDRMAAFSSEIRGPATGLYAFGVLLPLALVGVVPAAAVAGFPVPTSGLVAVYVVLLPAALSTASVWLLTRRPVAFPPPTVSRDHPDVPDRRWPAAALGGCAGVAAALLAGAFLPPWTRPLSLVGLGCGTALVLLFRPFGSVRAHVRAVELNLPDVLYLIGRRVGEGTAVETAINQVAAELPGETGATFETGARVQRQLRTSVREAFLGEYGALSDVPSPRARSTAALLALAAREGRPAGRAIVSMGDHLADLRSIERDARHELAAVANTLHSTAAAFGPLVAGATVALADGMSTMGSAANDGGTTSVAALGLTIGVYVLLLATILTALSTALERGFDRPLIGYRVGVSLASATTIYLVAFAAAGTLV